jgi:anaerobic C4-dicarboxylate transporter
LSSYFFLRLFNTFFLVFSVVPLVVSVAAPVPVVVQPTSPLEEATVVSSLAKAAAGGN